MITTLITKRYGMYKVGRNCTSIEEHRARGEGDQWYYDVHKNDKWVRIFDPLEVYFEHQDDRRLDNDNT